MEEEGRKEMPRTFGEVIRGVENGREVRKE